MAKILNSTTVNGNMTKMTELPDKFVINGQVYDKNTYSPIPLDFCPFVVSGNNEMNLLQTAYVNSSWYRNNTTCGYMIDNSDPSTCYIATQGIYGGSGNGAVHKLTKNSNGTWLDTITANWGPSYSPFIDLISQDNQKIYYTINRTNSDYSFIGYVNKTTNANSYVNVGKGTIKILKDTDMYIYFGASNVNALTYSIMKYDKVNNSISILLADTLSQGWYFELICSDMDSNGVFYCMRDGLGLGQSTNCVAFRKYILNTTKDTVTISNVTVDYSLLPAGKIQLLSGNSVNITHSLTNFTDPNTGKKYINQLIYNKGTQNGTSLNINECALYTYEIIDADNRKLVSYTNFSPIIYKTFSPVINNQTIMLAYENGCQIYTWDTGTTSYKKVNSFDAPIMAVGIDSNNNLYIQYTDTSIEMVSNVMPVTVFADFECDVYDYKGTDLTANIITYVKNYQGKYLSTSIQLTLYGNCKFTDTGLRTKTITTSNLDKITLPVTITDCGNLRVAVKIL
jgi:hypothetical protein